MTRRGWLGLALRGLALAVLGAEVGCSSDEPPRTPGPQPLPPLATSDLGALIPAAGLSWAVRARPREIAQVPWLIPAIAAFAPEERLDRWRTTMAFDLRQTTEAWFARHDLGAGPSDLTLVRHNGRPEELERGFLARISQDPVRAEDRPDVVRIGGRIGPEAHGFVRLGRDVAAYQERGEPARGVLRIVAARAAGQLGEVRDVVHADPLGALLTRFGAAPLVAIAPGPFDAIPEVGGEAARLLSVATGLGASLRPTARRRLGLALAVAGPFGDGAAGASEVLLHAWEHLAASETGRILALDRTMEEPLSTHTPEAVALSLELDPTRVAEGLRALVEQDLDALLGRPR